MVTQALTVALVRSVLQVLDCLGPSGGRRRPGDVLNAEAVEEPVTVGISPESP